MIYNMLCLLFHIASSTLVETTITQAIVTATPTNVATFGVSKPLSTTKKPMATPKEIEPEVSTLDTGEYSQDLSAEFEASLTEKQQDKYMIYRSEASENKTFHITTASSGRRYETTLCVKSTGDKKVKLQVIGIIYSNDGPSDTITLQLDGAPLGSTKTEEVYNGGHEWNVFKDTGPIGEEHFLGNGNHSLTMDVTTDQWGAEFDVIKFRVRYQDPGAKLLCKSELI